MRYFLRLSSLLAVVIAAASTAACAADRPNVVIFLADDLGYADIGMQKLSDDVKTPNVDSIAQKGVRFTQAYVSCPVCAPSRAGLMSGRYQQRFGFEENPSPKAPPNYGMPDDQVLMPAILKDAGYSTGMFGKWH